LLGPDTSEAWGIVDEKEKQKEQEMIKKNSMTSLAKRMGHSVQISKITLEIGEAEKIMADQKKRIGDLETLIRTAKAENHDKEEKRQALLKKLEDMKAENQKEIQELEKSKEEKINRNSQNKELNERLKMLLAFERKKRKLIERKAFILQSVLRKSENFIIATDSFYNKCFKGILA